MKASQKSFLSFGIVLFIMVTVAQSLAGPMMMRHGKGPGVHPHSMGFFWEGSLPATQGDGPGS